MNEDVFSFESLKVYKVARELVKNVYILQNTFPKEERYALGDQIAFGSMTEVFCELQTAYDLNYITNEQINNLRPQFTEVAKMLSGLRKKFQTL